jgi:hypothetical protein
MANGMFAGGSGIITDPYLIEDPADLDAIRRNVTACYKLINNINLGAPPYSIGKGWDPIENFNGRLDGNNKKIINMYINRSDEDYVGFFGNTSVPVPGWQLYVTDIGFENANVQGRTYVGILFGHLYAIGSGWAGTAPDSVIDRVYATGKVTGVTQVGGLIGRVGWSRWYINAWSWVPIKDCLTMASIIYSTTLNPACVGGIIGFCYNMVDGYYGNAMYISVQDCMSFCTFQSASGNKYAYSIVGDYQYGNYQAAILATNLYDSTLLSGNPVTPNTTGIDTASLKDFFSTLLLPFKTRLIGDKSLWRFDFGKYPTLWFTRQACYFVRVNGDYMTWNESQRKWVKQFDLLPSTPVILTKGMPSVSTLDTNAWNQLKQYGTVDIINFLESTEKLFVSNAKIDLTLDAEQVDENIISFRKEILFADYNNDIVTVVP